MTKNSLSAIAQQLKDMTGWMKGIDEKLKLQNSRIAKTELKIALVKQKHDLESKWSTNVETWSRKKMIGFGTALVVFLEILSEFFKNQFM